jgi:hypothetical protein
MPRAKGDNTCSKCKRVFANRQNLYRHVNRDTCEEKQPIAEQMQATIDKLVTNSLKDQTTIADLSDTVAKLKTSVAGIMSMPLIVNIELNVFNDRGTSYPNYKEEPEMRDILKTCFKQGSVSGLMRFLFFNDEYPRNRNLKPAKDGSIFVFTGTDKAFEEFPANVALGIPFGHGEQVGTCNGWERRPSDVVFNDVMDVFNPMLYGYMSTAVAGKDISVEDMKTFYKNIVAPFEWQWDELSDYGFSVAGFRGSVGCKMKKEKIY